MTVSSAVCVVHLLPVGVGGVGGVDLSLNSLLLSSHAVSVLGNVRALFKAAWDSPHRYGEMP